MFPVLGLWWPADDMFHSACFRRSCMEANPLGGMRCLGHAVHSNGCLETLCFVDLDARDDTARSCCMEIPTDLALSVFGSGREL